MKESKKNKKIEQRSDARILRSALDEVKAIQTLLADVYKDSGDGRTLLRELVQNADDAKSRRLVFTIFKNGWPEAENSLLRGPALVVVNDGLFTSNDHEALHKALGGSKAEEADKAGRFGIGLKSVFHICETILYIGADNIKLRPGALNPWAGTGKKGNSDPIHPDWDFINNKDVERLYELTDSLIGEFNKGLLLWIPLRHPGHLDRAQDKKKQYGLGQQCFKENDIAIWFKQSKSFAILISQCGYLKYINAYQSISPSEIKSRTQLFRVARPSFNSCDWVGRYEEIDKTCNQCFEGKIETDNQIWIAKGIEALSNTNLTKLRSQDDWPQDPYYKDGLCDWIPRKALEHAAITILQPQNSDNENLGVCFRWAVFLPLDDSSKPKQSNTVEIIGNINNLNMWEIILHGYFWPSHDRRSIPGVTNKEKGTGESALRINWNQAVRDELMFPLMPIALSKAIQDVSDGCAKALIKTVADSKIFKNNKDQITKRHLLLPLIAEKGIQWEIINNNKVKILSIPDWNEASINFRKNFLMLSEQSNNYIYIDHDSPRLGGKLDIWPCECVKKIIECIPSEMFHCSEYLIWIRKLLKHLMGEVDKNQIAVANWLAIKIGTGALEATTGKLANEKQKEELRTNWLLVFKTLPHSWIVFTPLAAQKAVEELAKKNVIGARLLPVPLGVNEEVQKSDSRPDEQKIDNALLMLGNLLKDDVKISQRLRSSRLLLAEYLIRSRGTSKLGKDLENVPLIRALKLPNNIDEAWSISDLNHHKKLCRVFSKVNKDNNSCEYAPLDPKKAVTELSEGLGEPVWLINFVAFNTEVPIPNVDNLAIAIIKTENFSSNPEKRIKLLERLAETKSINNQNVCKAIITLLTEINKGTVNEKQYYYIRSQDSKKDDNKKTLRILLHLLGKPWCAIEANLIESLPHIFIEKLQIKAVDDVILHSLLYECLNQSVDWSNIDNNETIHLLRCLSFSFGNSDNRLRWRMMPLHRDIEGNRTTCDDTSMKVNEAFKLPLELQTEIRLIDPDPEVKDIYYDIPTLDKNGILNVMLNNQQSYKFANQIIQNLCHEDNGQVVMPDNSKLINLLKNSSWLPIRDNQSGISPEKLIILNNEKLHKAVQPLAKKGVLNNYCLIDELYPEFLRSAEEVVYEIMRQISSKNHIHKLASAIETSKVIKIQGGAYSIFPDPKNLDSSFIDNTIQSPLPDIHNGWALVRSTAEAFGIDSQKSLDSAKKDEKNCVINVARSLCGEVPSKYQISVLKVLAKERPSRNSISGTIFKELISEFAKSKVFFKEVLPYLELPTQDGKWHKVNEIARASFGIARRHMLLSEFRDILNINTDEPVDTKKSSEHISSSSTAEILSDYFNEWRNRLPEGSVGAFLSLLGDGQDNSIKNLSQSWLGEDISVENIRDHFIQDIDRDPFESLNINVSEYIACGMILMTYNLINEKVEMGISIEDDAKIFATNPTRRLYPHRKIWKITLRNIEPQKRTSHELISLLKNSVEWWAKKVLHIEYHEISSWWAKWGTGSQVQIAPVEASILAHLPLTLNQLNVNECLPLKNALQKAQKAQRRREQSTGIQLSLAIRSEREYLAELSSLIKHEDYHRFIWKRVQNLIRRYGYSEDSILMELAQNADDALSQSAEIAGKPLPKEIRKLKIHISNNKDSIIDIIHYGRPINDTGGSHFPDGRDRQWDQDIYFMMLLNLSSKQGENPGQNSSNSTTGRFGLGFKSVHLVSDSPSVVSGFISFSIIAGLLPVEEKIPDTNDLEPIKGYHATRIRLRLRKDKNSKELIDKMFQRFKYTSVILPVFARQLSEIIIKGSPYSGISSFDNEQIDSAPGWSISKKSINIGENEQWHLLRFRPADGNIGSGTEAIVFGLKDGLPCMFPSEIPFMWNVTPTSENWGCGYAVNGPFKLDPGRSHVSLEARETIDVINFLGKHLGKGLINLHDTIINGTSKTKIKLSTREGAKKFLSSLWHVLITGLNEQDRQRKDILLRLHGLNRGVSFWMANRSALPSGLPPPFPYWLPNIVHSTPIEIAANDLDNPYLCKAIEEIKEMNFLIQKHLIISQENADRICPLRETEFTHITPLDILKELSEVWDNFFTPDSLHSLRPFAEDSIWKIISNDSKSSSWHFRLRALSASGDYNHLRFLLLPLNSINIKKDFAKDELLRAAFAPDENILDPSYIKCLDDVKVFHKLRVRHEMNSEKIASWYDKLSVEKQPDALHYLMFGDLNNEVIEHLKQKEIRPYWLDSYDELLRMIENMDEVEYWRQQSLLSALFPNKFQPKSESVKLKTIIPESAKVNFFKRLKEWWDDQNERNKVIREYENKTWPNWLRRESITNGLCSDSNDYWLGLLILGACRSLGLTKASQHRNFLEYAKEEGWWDIFKKPDDTSEWMSILRNWQDNATENLKFHRWMSLFPAIYQFSRYIDKYRRLLKSAGKRPENLYSIRYLLSPRIDSALTGAGQQFDAPPAPLNMGLHWIMRELVRLKVIDGVHLFPDCWVPSDKLLRLLSQLGMSSHENIESNPEKAKEVFEFISIKMQIKHPNLHRAFDIPINYINENLRKDFGLED